MDDSCAVCAEPLEWVAYGACGHKEVCSTCVARLRFICNDRRCCICKDESNVVFVTKALGDYTRMVNDFSVLPSEVKEGRVGSYWYHEDTRALFDDLDHYKMIKAMCRLSCSVCDKMGDQPTEGLRRRGKFRNIEQLKGHLFHQHRLLICSLCLEGRKVFICEQKLYTRVQLNQHISTGDSEVDGTESERGGFMGHPVCEFCRSPFYGDNELYSHMSTEHYTCHICQRQHPGQYEYYKNYDDLEIHFRQVHFLCEDEACLAKKFIVFQTENEMKRHNTIEHGGRMSRSKRNAALQIPTSFRYRHGNEDNRRGRGRSFRRDSSDAAALSMAIQASYETANGDGRFHDSSPSVAQGSPDHAEVGDVDPIIQPLESLATGDPEPSSRYLQAVSQRARNAKLEEFSFPPLPMAPGNSQQKPSNAPESLPKNTIAAHLRRQTNKNLTAITSNQAWLPASRGLAISANSPIQVRPTANIPSGGSPSTAQNNVPGFDSFKAWPVASRKPAQPTNSQVHVRHTTSGPSSSSPQNELPKQKAPAPSSFPSLPQARLTIDDYESSFAGSRSSSKDFYGSSKISRSSSTPNLAANVSFEPSESDFPPVSTSQTRKQAATHQVILKTENVHTANKSLVEKIRAGLEYDQDKYSAFKDISGEYRQGLMDSGTYLVYVVQFGLSHLVLDLARLCPDAEKQKEMVEIYNANLVSNDSRENFVSNDKVRSRDGPGSKGKGKALDAENSSSKDKLSDSILSTVRKLQSSYMQPQEESEVLSKDGYRTGKGKSKVIVDEPRTEFGFANQPLKLKSQDDPRSAGGGSGQSLGDRDGKTKQRKKTPKFIRVRLGDGSVAALSDLKNSDPDPDAESFSSAPDGNKKIGEGLPIRGVWQNGGGQKLFVNDSKRTQN